MDLGAGGLCPALGRMNRGTSWESRLGGMGKGPFLQLLFSTPPRGGEGVPFTSRMFAQELRAQVELPAPDPLAAWSLSSSALTALSQQLHVQQMEKD